MAYKRGLPTFNKDIEPKVKKTVIQNPDGTTTYRDTWSSKTPARSSSYKAPASKQGTKTVVKRSTPAQTMYGERETTTFPTITPKPITSQKITAPTEIKVPVKTPTRKETYESDKSAWEKDHPGKKWEERYKDAKPAKKEKWQGKGSFKEKKAIKLCNNC